MKKTAGFVILIFFCAALLAVSGGAKDKPAASLWTNAPLTIDGAILEWEGDGMLTDKKSKAEYAFRNDGENLYILFAFRDGESLSTIEATGMTIYYTLDSKKRKKDGLHFVKRQVGADALIASLERKGEVLPEETKEEMRKRPAYILYEGELVNPPKHVVSAPPAERLELPTFRSQKNPDAVFYEFRIPLDHDPRLGGLGARPGQTVTLGFEWGGLTEQMIAARLARAAESSTRGSGGGGSIDPLGEREERADVTTGSGTMMRSPAAKKHSFWVDVVLAGQGS